MTTTDVSTPPAAPAALGGGCDRTGSPSCDSAGHPLARVAQLRHGCCPPPASLTPLELIVDPPEAEVLALASPTLLEVLFGVVGRFTLFGSVLGVESGAIFALGASA